jgi:hypothetical protein
MRPASSKSRRPEPRLAAGLALLAAAACAPRDASVGVGFDPARDAGGADGAVVLFSSELAGNGGLWDVYTPLPGAGVTFGAGYSGVGSRDGRVAALVFPGDPNLTAMDRTDSSLNTGISTKQFFRYGTFRARVQFATCAAGEDVTNAVFMYFADGADANGNGIADLHELDFHVLCAEPTFIVLTAWSDYQIDGAGAETFLKRSHAIDPATGDVYDTPVANERAFVKTGNLPEVAHPGFPSADTLYDVGIEWQPDHVRFFILLDGREITLWTLAEPAFVPQVPLPMMFNLWHPPASWGPGTIPADYPAQDAALLVDWAEWQAP